MVDRSSAVSGLAEAIDEAATPRKRGRAAPALPPRIAAQKAEAREAREARLEQVLSRLRWAAPSGLSERDLRARLQQGDTSWQFDVSGYLAELEERGQVSVAAGVWRWVAGERAREQVRISPQGQTGAAAAASDNSSGGRHPRQTANGADSADHRAPVVEDLETASTQPLEVVTDGSVSDPVPSSKSNSGGAGLTVAGGDETSSATTACSGATAERGLVATFKGARAPGAVPADAQEHGGGSTPSGSALPIGERITAALASRGWRQVDLARRLAAYRRCPMTAAQTAVSNATHDRPFAAWFPAALDAVLSSSTPGAGPTESPQISEPTAPAVLDPQAGTYAGGAASSSRIRPPGISVTRDDDASASPDLPEVEKLWSCSSCGGFHVEPPWRCPRSLPSTEPDAGPAAGGDLREVTDGLTSDPACEGGSPASASSSQAGSQGLPIRDLEPDRTLPGPITELRDRIVALEVSVSPASGVPVDVQVAELAARVEEWARAVSTRLDTLGRGVDTVASCGFSLEGRIVEIEERLPSLDDPRSVADEAIGAAVDLTQQLAEEEAETARLRATVAELERALEEAEHELSDTDAARSRLAGQLADVDGWLGMLGAPPHTDRAFRFGCLVGRAQGGGR